MTRGHGKHRLPLLLAIGLVAITAVRGTTYLVATLRASPPIGLEAIQEGLDRKKLDVEVRGTDGATSLLSDHLNEACAYVIVYSATCGPCRAAFQSLELRHRGEIPLVPPPGWSVALLSIDSVPAESPVWRLVPAERIFTLVGGIAVARKRGFVATPFQLVIDEQGTIASSNVGVRLWNATSLRPGCVIGEDEASSHIPGKTWTKIE